MVHSSRVYSFGASEHGPKSRHSFRVAILDGLFSAAATSQTLLTKLMSSVHMFFPHYFVFLETHLVKEMFSDQQNFSGQSNPTPLDY